MHNALSLRSNRIFLNQLTIERTLLLSVVITITLRCHLEYIVYYKMGLRM